MDQTASVVTIIGGSGFLGRSIARLMAERGWHVKLGSRQPKGAAVAAEPGQISAVTCDIRDPASIASAVAGSEAVINTVGVLWENGANTFKATQELGAETVAKAAAAAGAARFVHISAIGASKDRGSDYAATKYAGEQAVLAAFPQAVILRPSIIFGAGDGFFNQFAGMAKMSPVIPLVGASTKFQPVWVEDVAEAAARSAVGEAAPGLYELGGPRVATFRECIDLMLSVVNRRRLVTDIPMAIARLQGWVLEKSALLGIQPVLTSDQVKLLDYDNVVSPDAQGFAALGMTPTPMEQILPTYLTAKGAN